MSQRQIVVYGSCLGRDTFEVLKARGFRLGAYVARQSLLSAGTDSSNVGLDSSLISSPFQRRNFEGDLAGNAFSVISHIMKRDQQAILLWDLLEERCGVYRTPGGHTFTRGIDALSNLVFEEVPEDWRLQQFGSDAHRLAFMEATDQFRNLLLKIGAWERTFVLAVDWASVSIQGTSTPGSYGFSAARANEVFAEYYDYLRYEGWKVVSGPAAPLADDNHKWGLAPFHYAENVYTHLSDALMKLMPRLASEE